MEAERKTRGQAEAEGIQWNGKRRKSFVRNIEQIVDTAAAPITVVCDTAPVNRGIKQIYLSASSEYIVISFQILSLAEIIFTRSWS